MELVVQYILIGIVFVVALYFLIRRFMPTKGKSAGCNKGCGCSMTEVEKQR